MTDPMKLLLNLALLGAASLSGAQTIQHSDAASLKALDAQALAFTGRHCSVQVSSKPPRAASLADFKRSAGKTEASIKAARTQDKTLKYRSKLGGDSYLLAIEVANGQKKNGFAAMLLKAGQLYVYTCELK